MNVVGQEGMRKTLAQKFANTAREAIAEAGHLKLSERTYKEKKEYHIFLRDHGYA